MPGVNRLHNFGIKYLYDYVTLKGNVNPLIHSIRIIFKRLYLKI